MILFGGMPVANTSPLACACISSSGVFSYSEDCNYNGSGCIHVFHQLDFCIMNKNPPGPKNIPLYHFLQDYFFQDLELNPGP